MGWGRSFLVNSLVLLTLITVLSGAVAAHADVRSTPSRTWATNGEVHAVAATPGAVYIGGRFTEVGPRTGPGVGIDASSAKNTGLPQVAGGYQTVEAVARDGSGGFYIGGNFRRVGGLHRRNLAHILADGSVDATFNPSPNDSVKALAISGATVYVGGAFTSIDGQPRHEIAALSATTGTATSWNPDAAGTDAYVGALAVSGATVYAGGTFTSIGGQTRNGVAALNSATGAARNWNPSPNYPKVFALAVSGSTVYVGGGFTSIGGQARNGIAALDAATGDATSWDPHPDSAKVYALAVSGSTVYAGGNFNSIGGQTRHHLAAIDATSGAPTSWDPNANGFVYALAVSGSTVYIGGWFDKVGGQARKAMAAVDATTGAPTSWSPNANGAVHSLVISGATVYAGGDFTSIGVVARKNVAALDPATGAATSWNPNANDVVWALAASGSTVYVGGWFDQIGGQARDGLAAIDATSGTATSWDPTPLCSWCFDGPVVYALAVSGSTVYAGGNFTSIGGQTRHYLAALDATTGAATSWNPNATGAVGDLLVSGSTVYADGAFDYMGINPRPRHGLAAIDATTGKATSWNPHPSCLGGCPADGFVDALAISGSTIYVGGGFTSIGGQARNGIAALDATTGNATSFKANPDSTESYPWVKAIAVSGSTVYVGGHFNSFGSQVRNYAAALNGTTGNVTSWNPNPNNDVDALAVAPDGALWAGGYFFGFPAAAQSHIAKFAP